MGLDTAIARVQRRFRGRGGGINAMVSASAQTLTVPPICRREIIPHNMLEEVENVKQANEMEQIRARRRERRKNSEKLYRIPRLSQESLVIKEGELLRHVMENVPPRHQGCDLQCVYSTANDGVSLGTLYERVRNDEPIILLIRDTGGAIFGSFAAHGYQPDTSSRARYTGTGEAFVFTVKPKPQVYRWRRTNNFYHLCTPNSIAIGGGGSFALFLDNMLLHGSSGESDTFGNTCLASESQFEAVVVEAYKLVVPARLHLG